MKERSKSIFKKILLGLIGLVILLLIPPVANAIVNAVGHLAGWTSQKVDNAKAALTDATKGGVAVVVGLLVVYAAVAFIALPVVAVAVVVVGLVLIGWGLYSIFKKSDTESTMPGNTTIDIPKG